MATQRMVAQYPHNAYRLSDFKVRWFDEIRLDDVRKSPENSCYVSMEQKVWFSKNIPA
jgi:hypothetical protein